MLEKNVRDIYDLVKRHNEWRMNTINLIASENVVSEAVREIMCSDFAHRYAEGHPGERYYQGTKYIDEIEAKLKTDLKTLFNCDHTEVRPISGTNANEAVFSSYITIGDIVMVNSTPGGGHISHHRNGSVGKFSRNIVDFPLTPDGYHIDVEKTVYLIEKVHPRFLIFGKSLFLFPEPVKELKDICRREGIIIIYDAAHVLGLIAGRKFPNPLEEGADIVTASTHKTFFGTQRGLILSNLPPSQWQRIDRGAFPGSSSNHHLDTLVGLAVATYEMMEFGEAYASQVIKNAKALAKKLDEYGFDVQCREFGYTQTHQIAVDVRKFNGGKKVAVLLENNDIILNMNLLPHEPIEKVNNPSGIRIGVQEMTRFGMKEPEMEYIATLIKECVMDKKEVKEEVNKFRKKFQDIHYSFDSHL